LEQYEGLPQASSLCGACRDICPARIDIPRMLLALRRDTVERRLLPWPERLAERFVAAVLTSPLRTRFAAATGRLFQRPFVKNLKNPESQCLDLPDRLNPTKGRALPPLAPRSFHEMWKELEAETEP
jgi:L-lactate dehydrogenase complex protein LldF